MLWDRKLGYVPRKMVNVRLNKGKESESVFATHLMMCKRTWDLLKEWLDFISFAGKKQDLCCHNDI
jgi:hypothetical protein